MTIASSSRFSALIIAASMGVGCAAAPVTEDAELNAERQEFVASINGMKTINGLTTKNGLKTVNGLTTKNGLKTINGLMTINGLKTMNGLATINGLSVDCADRTAGVDCTGTPDGLLSADTGLMSSDDGIITAKYLVRCALPKGQSLRIQDYTGGLVTLTLSLLLVAGAFIDLTGALLPSSVELIDRTRSGLRRLGCARCRRGVA
ncbi:MAG: hypothetical protein RL385_2407, partial [Pseudomonadota bacterium]